ncbi:cytochrome c nitrite reductase small subunit [Mariniluteicoccus flavus]
MRGLLDKTIALLGGARQALMSVLVFLVSILFGVAVFTFGYANGWAYFGKDPKSCQQCHSMNEQYAGWEKGSHKNVATCQDCHSPADNPVKWAYEEADNGFWHSLKFTTGWYPENIKIREMNSHTTQENCLRCHKDFVSNIEGPRLAKSHDQQVNCLRCHNEVGHKR